MYDGTTLGERTPFQVHLAFHQTRGPSTWNLLAREQIQALRMTTQENSEPTLGEDLQGNPGVVQSGFPGLSENSNETVNSYHFGGGGTGYE